MRRLQELRNIFSGRQQSEFPFVRVLNRLHTKKHGGTAQGNRQTDDQPRALTELRTANSPRHRQAAEKQHASVESTQHFVQILTGKGEHFGM